MKKSNTFASTGATPLPQIRNTSLLPLSQSLQGSILERIYSGATLRNDSDDLPSELTTGPLEAPEVVSPPEATTISAGKNTYTYDAHTYHTKVPPQGVAMMLNHFLPSGGTVLDPFAGSGMTGVAALATGHNAILNELSPAASFIAERFTAQISIEQFDQAIATILNATQMVRSQCYTTECRECGASAEVRYTVWAYRLVCPHCQHDFNIWDVARFYGNTVREHKILPNFDCPRCSAHLAKRHLARTFAEPVSIGYICCGNKRVEVTHTPTAHDLAIIERSKKWLQESDYWYPTNNLPDGVNLRQPKGHGLTSVDKLYTERNLYALAAIWDAINRIEDNQAAAFSAWVFTSLYRRVTRLSEFRFWGGSGNSARLNVPQIFDETNAFLAFERKAKTIRDHLSTTAQYYDGRRVVVNGSATDLQSIPDSSIDYIFTDPPFGSNINYSDMNFLWESWLQKFTRQDDEAIVNRVQGKGVDEYQELMTQSMRECYRVLREGHWMSLVFMNSSAKIWQAINDAIAAAGFIIIRSDIFDKKHGTFKHFVSANTPGADLVLHCLKVPAGKRATRESTREMSLEDFLSDRNISDYLVKYAHVQRATEVDERKLYSEWVAHCLDSGSPLSDYKDFRSSLDAWIQRSVI